MGSPRIPNRQLLMLAIREAKVAAFEKLLSDVNSDPWGNAYRVVSKKIHPKLPLGTEAQLV